MHGRREIDLARKRGAFGGALRHARVDERLAEPIAGALEERERAPADASAASGTSKSASSSSLLITGTSAPALARSSTVCERGAQLLGRACIELAREDRTALLGEPRPE